MERRKVINKTKEYARVELEKGEAGHDWWHAFRVWQTAKYIARKEGGDLFVVELAALLHDIADHKFNKGKNGLGPKLVEDLFKKLKVGEETTKNVCEIIENMSFSLTGAKVKSRMNTLEGKIVQDADRLDALGAIGIARAFSYGGYAKREMYNPKIKSKSHGQATINHFYDKLLLLKKLMNTKTGKKLAGERHKFLEKYLKQFFKEWNIK